MTNITEYKIGQGDKSGLRVSFTRADVEAALLAMAAEAAKIDPTASDKTFKIHFHHDHCGGPSFAWLTIE